MESTINFKLLIFILFMMDSPGVLGQDFALAIRKSEHQGYAIFDQDSNSKFQLPRYAEPIFDGKIRHSFYPNLIKIPLFKNRFPVRYLGEFYLINLHGDIISKLPEETEWVHPFDSGISRVSLINFGKERAFNDMYIDQNGKNIFNKVFEDGSNFIEGKAAVKYLEEENWAIINTEGKELLNISNLIEKPISVVHNFQKNIWKIVLQNEREEIYFSTSGQVANDPKEFSQYIQIENNIDSFFYERLLIDQSQREQIKSIKNDDYRISTNTAEKIGPKEIKELILENPSKNDLSSITKFKNLEVLSIHGLKGEKFDFQYLRDLKLLECLNFIECRELIASSLNSGKTNLEFLSIKKCNKLKNFKPDKSKWVNLKMYAVRHKRKVTELKKTLAIRK